MEAPQVVLETSMGRIVLEMYVHHAPKTTKNFIELAKRCVSFTPYCYVYGSVCSVEELYVFVR